MFFGTFCIPASAESLGASGENVLFANLDRERWQLLSHQVAQANFFRSDLAWESAASLWTDDSLNFPQLVHAYHRRAHGAFS
jgi:hypothetical protein